MKVFNEEGKQHISISAPKIAHFSLVGQVRELLVGFHLQNNKLNKPRRGHKAAFRPVTQCLNYGWAVSLCVDQLLDPTLKV